MVRGGAGAEDAAMRRILVLAAMLTVALPTAADAAVIPSVSGGTLSVTGDGAADQITVRTAGPTSVLVNDIPFDRGTFSRIEIRSGGGDDNVRIADALTETVTIETGAGADVVTGGLGKETIATGDDADFVHAGGGDDTIVLGAGDDSAIQAEGVDSVEGQSGEDTLRAVGSAESEEFTLMAVGAQARIARDTVPATTDSAGVEVLDVTAAGGVDLVDIGNLQATDVETVEADLGLLDGARDEVAAQGSESTNVVDVLLSGEGGLVAQGLPGISLRVEGSQPASDLLTVRTLGGRDFIRANRDVGSRIALQFDGGEDNDTLTGSDAADVLRGGPGFDVLTGGRGADVADMGDGDDVFTRDQQAGDDRVDGGPGNDSVTMIATDADEGVAVSADGPRVRVTSRFPARSTSTAWTASACSRCAARTTWSSATSPARRRRRSTST
jgi:Ca2+-binding RTX toxin-like protein